MDANSQKLAQDILDALSTTNKSGIPVVGPPDPLPADADQKTRDAHDRHLQAHIAHINNKPTGQWSAAERTVMAQAIVSGLQADGFLR